ncbi:MAG: DUF962 domain-containing protein [Pseudomonadota bacterium]
MSKPLTSFRDFWPYYLGEHARQATRAFHLVGTGLGIVLLVTAVMVGSWPLAVGALIVGYGFAWVSHIFIERNRPATFRHPLWSLIGDLRMLMLFLSGGLGRELDRHNITGDRKKKDRHAPL